MIPYGKDNWRLDTDIGRGRWLAARGYAYCRVDVRGTGSSGGRRPRRVHRRRDARRLRRRRVGRRRALVERRGRDVGHQLRRVHGDPGRQAPAAPPPGDRAVHGHGRPLRRRRPLPRRLRDRQRAVAVRRQPGGDERDAAGRDAPRRRLAGRVARPARGTPPWLFEWLRHQTDGPYWRQGSLAPDYDAIEVPIYSIGGWMDSYVDPAFRMQARCTAPTRTLVGNWVHGWPGSAPPGPNLDDLHELVRFLDHHLRGIDNGADTEPPVVWFERDYAPPEPFPAALPGRWRAAGRVSRIRRAATVAWRFDGGDAAAGRAPARRRERGRSPERRRRGPLRAPSDDRHALVAVVGRPAARPTAWPATCGRTRAPGPTYTTEPLAEAVEILGVPEVVLHLSVSAPVATAVVRLTDVAPDGTSYQVSAGVLNLTHRRSSVDPEPLVPGRVETIRVPLRTAGYRFAPGHRIRVSVASSYWPVLWPSPYPGHLRAASRAGHAVPARPAACPAGRRSGRPARPGVQDDARGPARHRRPVRGGPAGLADRGGRPRRHDDGHDPRRWRRDPRRRPPPVRGRDARPDRLGPRSRDGQPRRGRRLPLARGREPDRDPGPLDPDEHGDRLRPVGGPRGGPRRRAASSSAAGTSASRAISSEPTARLPP